MKKLIVTVGETIGAIAMKVAGVESADVAKIQGAMDAIMHYHLYAKTQFVEAMEELQISETEVRFRAVGLQWKHVNYRFFIVEGFIISYQYFRRNSPLKFLQHQWPLDPTE
jgi:hypothetical protein